MAEWSNAADFDSVYPWFESKRPIHKENEMAASKEAIDTKIIFVSGHNIMVRRYKIMKDGEPIAIAEGTSFIEQPMLKDKMMLKIMADKIDENIEENLDGLIKQIENE